MSSVKILKDVNIDDVKPYKNNYLKHDNNVDHIANSIKDFGYNKVSIGIDDKGEMIYGHGTLQALKQLEMKTIPAVAQIDGLTEKQKKAYRIADNESARKAEIDFGILEMELPDFEDEFDLADYGFDMPEIDVIENEPEEEDEFDAEEEAGETKEPIAVLGDVWTLGNHRLVCGDSTLIDDVEKLMNGEKADMVFTDPPYNTGMTAESQAGTGGTLWKGTGKKSGKAWLSHMFNDSYTDDEWQDFMSMFTSNYFTLMKDNSVAYICLDWRRNYELIPHIKSYFKLSNIIVWDKVVHGLGSDYKYTYELINVCKKGKPEMDTHQGDREYSDVWHIQRKMGKDEDHATKKPLEIIERALRHSSKQKDIIVDLFGGSGSTLIACEQLNRKCYMMELDEKYVSVIIFRWIKYMIKLGKEKEIIVTNNGKTIDYLDLVSNVSEGA